MELNEIISTLQSKTLQIEPSIFAELSKLKKGFVISGEEDRANEIWFYETVARVHSEFVRVYELLKDDEYEKYSTAWCQLERIENEIGCIQRITRKGFLSLVFPILNPQFSICKESSHISSFLAVNRLLKNQNVLSAIKKHRYDILVRIKLVGSMMENYVVSTLWKLLLAVSVVENPADKFGLLRINGKRYDYTILQQLMKNWDNPFDEWSVLRS